ncbi:MAG: hypothetical protein E2O39_03875 [Planctomycetota bacterium]|nr:MAG: hypothetical protein E2O39_03875 [Planctomycetota bacterium]
MNTEFRLRQLPAGVRLGLTLLLCVNLGGFVASGLHMRDHHENRDGRPGLALDDLRGAYSGLKSDSALVTALESGHPGELDGAASLSPSDTQLLLAWLASDRISEDFDNLDLGDSAPAEILAASCLQCHSRSADDPIGGTLPLEYWDDVKRVAFAREISATDVSILLASTHTHAIALATATIVLAGLMLLTSWPSALKSTLVFLAGLGLSVDLAAWWLARDRPELVYAIIGGGAVYALSMVWMMLAVIVDLWRPRP